MKFAVLAITVASALAPVLGYKIQTYSDYNCDIIDIPRDIHETLGQMNRRDYKIDQIPPQGSVSFEPETDQERNEQWLYVDGGSGRQLEYLTGWRCFRPTDTHNQASGPIAWVGVAAKDVDLSDMSHGPA